MDDWGPNRDYRSYLTEINHVYWLVKSPSLCFWCFPVYFRTRESNQMGKQKKNNLSFIWVWIQLRLSNAKEKRESYSSLYFSYA